jgi:hypothetical protein
MRGMYGKSPGATAMFPHMDYRISQNRSFI